MPLLNVFKIKLELNFYITFFIFSIDLKDKALEVAQQAVTLNPDSAKLQETFENICCQVIDRWHFKMLNDIKRNEAFEKAIKEMLAGDKVHKLVCDIGSGTGLLR